MYDIFIKNGFVYYNGRFQKKNIGITGEKISYVGNDVFDAKKVVDASSKKIIPGLIDPHVHFALYCGTVTSVDDFETGSRCAAYGGVTTIIDFLDPTRNARKLLEKIPIKMSATKALP